MILWPIVPAPRRLALCLLLAACKGDGDQGSGTDASSGDAGSATSGDEPTTGDPVCTDCTPVGPLSFRLPSPAGATLWTATTMDKILREAAPPAATVPAIQIHAARNEYEPFQLVVHADEAELDVSVSVSEFTGPGPLPPLTLHRVDYVQIAAPSRSSTRPRSRARSATATPWPTPTSITCIRCGCASWPRCTGRRSPSPAG